MTWSFTFLEAKQKNIFPLTFNKATGRKLITPDWFSGLAFGMYTSDVTHHCTKPEPNFGHE